MPRIVLKDPDASSPRPAAEGARARLDPQMAQLIEQLDALGGPPLETLSPPQARRGYAGIRALSGSTRLAEARDLTLRGPGGALPARLYLPTPASPEAPLPAVVYLHGGGWVIGSVETHDGLCRALAAASGCALVSVDYRLAPEHKFPAAVDDAYAALCEVAARAQELCLDPARLAIGGDSAGGTLATVACLMARERGGPTPRAQLLLYPSTSHDRDTTSHAEFASGFLLTRPLMEWFSAHYLRGPEDARHPYVAPLHAEDLRGLPPALIVTAELDPLRDEAEAYARRLEDAGVPVWLRRYGGAVHGFLQMAGVVPAARAAIAEIGAELRRAL